MEGGHGDPRKVPAGPSGLVIPVGKVPCPDRVEAGNHKTRAGVDDAADRTPTSLSGGCASPHADPEAIDLALPYTIDRHDS